MSKINDLIKELCPNGVEYKKISDCCDFQNGYAFKSNLFKDDGDILLRITNINGKEIDLSDVKYIDINDYKVDLNNFIVKHDEIVIAMSGATTGKVGLNRTTAKLYLNQRVGKITPKNNQLNNRFLYHVLLSKTNYFYQLAGGGAQPNLSSASVKNTMIPVPPLEVQEEIVRILDKFDALEAELETELEVELEARKSQYEFWRGKLLDINVEYKKLEEVALKISDGSHNPPKGTEYKTNFPMISAKNMNNGYYDLKDVRYLTKEDFVKENKRTNAKQGDILLSIVGSVGKVLVLQNNNPITFQRSICVIKPNQYFLDSNFLKHVLQSSKYQNILNNKSNGAAQKGIYLNQINNLEIPIPPLEEQKRIANILDKLDNLVNNILIELPAEIEARRKQYEYYRNKLLTFEEVSCE